MKKLLFCASLVALCAGCGSLERVNPAARSASTTYNIGDIKADNGSTVNLTIGDGAMAAADGDGSITQPTTTTTSVPTSITTPASLNPISLGIRAIESLASKGMDIYAATATSQQPTSAQSQSASAGCEGGACSEAPCEGGACSE